MYKVLVVFVKVLVVIVVFVKVLVVFVKVLIMFVVSMNPSNFSGSWKRSWILQ